MSETPNEGAGGVSVEGQDERTRAWLASAMEGDDLSQQERMEDVVAGALLRYDWQTSVGAGAMCQAVYEIASTLAARAALVESEARERERQAKLDGLGEMVAHYERERAVLVEALRKAEADFEWIVAHDPESGAAGLARQGRNAVRESLAGVVEAEPAEGKQ